MYHHLSRLGDGARGGRRSGGRTVGPERAASRDWRGGPCRLRRDRPPGAGSPDGPGWACGATGSAAAVVRSAGGRRAADGPEPSGAGGRRPRVPSGSDAGAGPAGVPCASGDDRRSTGGVASGGTAGETGTPVPGPDPAPGARSAVGGVWNRVVGAFRAGLVGGGSGESRVPGRVPRSGGRGSEAGRRPIPGRGSVRAPRPGWSSDPGVPSPGRMSDRDRASSPGRASGRNRGSGPMRADDPGRSTPAVVSGARRPRPGGVVGVRCPRAGGGVAVRRSRPGAAADGRSRLGGAAGGRPRPGGAADGRPRPGAAAGGRSRLGGAAGGRSRLEKRSKPDGGTGVRGSRPGGVRRSRPAGRPGVRRSPLLGASGSARRRPGTGRGSGRRPRVADGPGSGSAYLRPAGGGS